MYSARVSANSCELLWFGIAWVRGVKNCFGRPYFDMGICFGLALEFILKESRVPPAAVTNLVPSGETWQL
jgi:hypothetical protein